MLSIEKLYKSYTSQSPVINGLNASFEQGTITGIVGKNGAGKTTLFNCMSGIIKYEGEIRFNGNTNIKMHLSYLNTHPHYLKYLTGREYLNYYIVANELNINKLDDWNLFELPLDQYATDYSTGMKKKLALTAILLDKKPIYLLDEPFNGVDIQSNLMFKALLNKLKAHNKTVILSSHIFESLTEICDQIMLLENGIIEKIYEPNTYNELASSIYNSKDLAQLDTFEKLWSNT